MQTFCLLGVKLWQDINKRKRPLITLVSRHLHAPEKWILNHISPNKNSTKKNVRPFWPENSFFASSPNGWAQHLKLGPGRVGVPHRRWSQSPEAHKSRIKNPESALGSSYIGHWSWPKCYICQFSLVVNLSLFCDVLNGFQDLRVCLSKVSLEIYSLPTVGSEDE